MQQFEPFIHYFQNHYFSATKGTVSGVIKADWLEKGLNGAEAFCNRHPADNHDQKFARLQKKQYGDLFSSWAQIYGFA